MSLPSLAPELERAGTVRWLSRREPILAGPSLGEMAWGLRGWRDDFMGQVLHEQYDQRLSGAGSTLVLQPNAQGGVLRLTAGAGVLFYARIMLGDRAYAFNSLDADNGWLMVGRFKISHTTSIRADMFVTDALVNAIHIIADTLYGANWYLKTDNNSGLDNVVDSGVPTDTDWHVHRLEVTSGRAEHWLDGQLINYTTVKIPTVVETGNVRCLANAAASRYMDLDYWETIPR